MTVAGRVRVFSTFNEGLAWAEDDVIQFCEESGVLPPPIQLPSGKYSLVDIMRAHLDGLPEAEMLDDPDVVKGIHQYAQKKSVLSTVA